MKILLVFRRIFYMMQERSGMRNSCLALLSRTLSFYVSKSLSFLSLFIEVIPLDGSIDHGALTYFIPNDLAKQTNIGSLVEVPWRNTLSYAIVTKIGSESIPEGVRSVSMLACSLPILTPYQIETILDLARHYFVHAHQILSLFLPKLFVRSMEKKSFAQLVHMKAERNKKMTKPTLLHISGKQDIYAVLNNHIESKKNDGVVVIFPDDFAVE